MYANRRRVLYFCAALTLLVMLCCALPLHRDCGKPACALCGLMRMQRAALGLASAFFTLRFAVKARYVGRVGELPRASVHPTLFDLRIRLSV